LAHPRYAFHPRSAPDDPTLAEALTSRAPWVRLDGAPQGDWAALCAALTQAGKRLQLHVRADALPADPQVLTAWRAAGMEQLHIDLVDATVEQLAPTQGINGLFVAGHLPLSWTLPVEAAWLTPLVAFLRRLTLHCPSRDPRPRRRRAALDTVRASLEVVRTLQIPVQVEGLRLPPPRPRGTDNTPWLDDGLLWHLFEQGAPFPMLPPTVRPTSWPHADALAQRAQGQQRLGLALSITGTRVQGAPVCEGGDGATEAAQRGAACAACPQPRCQGAPHPAGPLPAWAQLEGLPTAVVLPYVADGILVRSTFRMLAQALRDRGQPTKLLSAYKPPFSPEPVAPLPALPCGRIQDGAFAYDTPAARLLTHGATTVDVVRRRSPQFLKHLRLQGAKVIVVPGWEAGMAVWQHPTRDPDATVILADFHCREGLPQVSKPLIPQGSRPMDGNWWPSPQLIVHSAFPQFAAGYWRAGVPMEQIRWRPYPMAQAHFPPGPPAAQCPTAFGAGNHQRDWATLTQALAKAGPLRHPLRIATEEVLPNWVQTVGMLTLHQLHEAIANARYVAIPLLHTPSKPAGLSILAMARAAGRPVLTTSSPSTLGLVQHGVDGIVVEAGDVEGWAHALARFDTDDALITQLEQGAQAAGARDDVGRWAEEILGRHVPAPLPPDDRGNRRLYATTPASR